MRIARKAFSSTYALTLHALTVLALWLYNLYTVGSQKVIMEIISRYLKLVKCCVPNIILGFHFDSNLSGHYFSLFYFLIIFYLFRVLVNPSSGELKFLTPVSGFLLHCALLFY